MVMLDAHSLSAVADQLVIIINNDNKVVCVSCVVFCRYDGNALLSCIEVYNQQTESWELLEKGMTTQRCDAGLTVVHLR